MSRTPSSSPASHLLFTVLPFVIIFIAWLLWPVSQPAAANEPEDESPSSSPFGEETTMGDGGFSFSLQLLNPVSEEPQKTFFFGDEVGYKIAIDIPPAAEGKLATVKLTASVKVGALALPFTASNVFKGPVTNPTSKEIDIFQPLVWKDKFKLPSELPVSKLTATIKVVVTIADIGTKSITRKITIQQPT